VSFDVTADAYSQFMGRFSEPLATKFVALTGLRPGQRALDVGCGPGALTAALVARLGAEDVCAIDPSEPFVAAVRDRLPGIDVRCGAAETPPFPSGEFDAVLAQLVVHFMAEPEAGLAEMKRVASPDSLVAACVWDHGSGRGPLSSFWHAVHETDPEARDESDRPGSHAGQLVQLFEHAGLHYVEPALLTVRVDFLIFDDWWEPFTFGVGPAGSYVAGLDPQRRDELRAHCAHALPKAPFSIEASAWTALGRA
jgi:SAM-dependent methyltransferase